MQERHHRAITHIPPSSLSIIHPCSRSDFPHISQKLSLCMCAVIGVCHMGFVNTKTVMERVTVELRSESQVATNIDALLLHVLKNAQTSRRWHAGAMNNEGKRHALSTDNETLSSMHKHIKTRSDKLHAMRPWLWFKAQMERWTGKQPNGIFNKLSSLSYLQSYTTTLLFALMQFLT